MSVPAVLLIATWAHVTVPVNVGLTLNTTLPAVPVADVAPVPPLATSNMPVVTLPAFSAVNPNPFPLITPVVVIVLAPRLSAPLEVMAPQVTVLLDRILSAPLAVIAAHVIVPVNVGSVLKTMLPVPVNDVVPVPPRAVESMPVDTLLAFSAVSPEPSPVMIPVVEMLATLNLNPAKPAWYNVVTSLAASTLVWMRSSST